ncbi:hypothetical protein V2E24_03065 [Mycoplasmopsis ciconiae]|uniref:Uncharacterized protein n=1 Tax=Mycoplasmopsis ciconiae TaxID=561067 RepID=A0ABU7MN03_9BACT|nr:hypothetical protein [Mycoplasmopsis ciconiae]
MIKAVWIMDQKNNIDFSNTPKFDSVSYYNFLNEKLKNKIILVSQKTYEDNKLDFDNFSVFVHINNFQNLSRNSKQNVKYISNVYNVISHYRNKSDKDLYIVDNDFILLKYIPYVDRALICMSNVNFIKSKKFDDDYLNWFKIQDIKNLKTFNLLLCQRR